LWGTNTRISTIVFPALLEPLNEAFFSFGGDTRCLARSLSGEEK
jgi:hypothetical protein